jgi:hypothetical protein
MAVGRNQVPNLRAGANINPSCFAQISTAADDTGLPCPANAMPAGITGVGTQDPPGVAGSLGYHAYLGGEIELFGQGDICLLTAGAGGFTAGQYLKSDGSANGGLGIPIASSGVTQAVGALALETAAAGYQGRVVCTNFWASPDSINNVGSIAINYVFNGTNLAVTGSFFTAVRAYLVTGISFYVDVLGTNGGAVTGQVFSAPSGTAISAGTALMSNTFNLKGTISTVQTATLGASLSIPLGTSIGFVLTGTATTAQGTVTVNLAPQ